MKGTRLLALALLLYSPAIWAQWKPLHINKQKLEGLRETLRPQKLALVIGVGQFRSKQWKPLRYAQQDALAMGQTLQAAAFDRIIHRTQKHQTTTAALIRSLKRLGELAKNPLDTVLVYISSHGTAAIPPQGKEPSRYIITSDTTNQIPKSALEVRKILSVLKQYRSSRILLILAVCYTGHPKSKSQVISGLKGPIQLQSALKSNSNAIQILSAASRGQAAYEHAALGSDVYSYYLRQCIAQKMKTAQGTVTAIGAHVCATPPTNLFVKEQLTTVQVPSVASESGANRDIFIVDNRGQKLKRGYFSTARTSSKEVVYQFQRVGTKGRTDNTLKASANELIALQPGRYVMTIKSADGATLNERLIEIQDGSTTHPTSPWAIALYGGLMGSALTGGPLLGGGALALRHRFFSIHLGLWTTHREYFASPAGQQLYFTLRSDLGYRFEWLQFELFVGGYAQLGWLLQNAFQEVRAGPTFAYGATANPCYWISPTWGIALRLDLGFALAQLAGQLEHQLQWSTSLGFHVRF